ncbi:MULTISPECIES: shufflon system plasmid conjugative transfer pilus tip adhesin PilV [unclassified Paraburkholderia]|uniref:shufflon system plasmid conjugative transfer pilus tip adhesin PilV n=1 Tax=unclassified Paraburkholderia TaxID=2615204 RepID=UPI002AB04811|nr:MULTISPECIES: shufflon system plasmid conjugative transfer pilus tip adhesin PilV [unclassified Paraburkholderia]
MDALLGYAMAILLSLMSVGTFIKWSDTGTKNILAAAVARQNVLFNKAVEQYVQDYAATLAGLVTSSSPTTITTAMLINTGYLPSGFSSTNAYGQTWEAQILQPSSGELETMVVSTGGTAISDQLQLVKIASQVGAEGGFIPYANQGGDSTMTTSYARGAYGGWKQAMTTFTNPGSGHLASLLAFTSSSTNTNYLYRVEVTGESQLNAMQTDLSLEDTSGTKHDINDVDALNTETVDASGDVTVGGTVTATGAINGSSTIKSSGRITSGEYLLADGSATLGSSCSVNGAIGTDGTQPLFCKSGVWHGDTMQQAMQQVGWFTNTDSSWETFTIGSYTFCSIIGSEPDNSDPNAGWNMYSDGGAGVRTWYVTVKDAQVLAGCYS